MSSNKQQLEEKFYLLQDLLTDEFISRIKTGDAEPSLLNAARQHLKDNSYPASMQTLKSNLAHTIPMMMRYKKK